MAQSADILLVDDDPDLLKLISLRLTSAGYRVRTADSGETALAALATGASETRSARKNLRRRAVAASLFGALVCATGVAFAAGFVETDLVANKKPLIDANGIVHSAVNVDANLQNPWGVGTSATSPFWVSDNGAGVSTLYNTAGTPQALVVSIPGPAPA